MLKKNILSILVALAILFLSLTTSESFNEVNFLNFNHLDKLVHFLMYAGFMSVIIFENRKSIKGNRYLFTLALIPFFYGIIMEILQLTVTASRSGDIYDIFFNSAGILASVILWIIIKPHLAMSDRD